MGLSQLIIVVLAISLQLAVLAASDEKNMPASSTGQGQHVLLGHRGDAGPVVTARVAVAGVGAGTSASAEPADIEGLESPTEAAQATSEEAEQQQQQYGRRHSRPTEASATPEAETPDAEGPPDHKSATGKTWEDETQGSADSKEEGKLDTTQEEDDHPRSAQGEEQIREGREGKHTASVLEEEQEVQSRSTQGDTPMGSTQEEEEEQLGSTPGEEHPTSSKVQRGEEEQAPYSHREQYGTEQYSNEQSGTQHSGTEQYSNEQYDKEQYGKEQYSNEQYGKEQYGKEQYSAGSDGPEQSYQDAASPDDHGAEEETPSSTKNPGGYEKEREKEQDSSDSDKRDHQQQKEDEEEREVQREPDSEGQYSPEDQASRRHEPQHTEPKKPHTKKRDAGGYTLQELIHQGGSKGQDDYYISYGHSRGCNGPPPACNRPAAPWHSGYSRREEEQKYYKTDQYEGSNGPSCASTGSVYAWPASCSGRAAIGMACSGAAWCQGDSVPASATASCTPSGWIVTNTCNVCEGAPPALPSNTWPTACTGAAVGTTCQGVCDTAVGTVAPVAACTSKQTGWVVVSGSCVAARCSGPLPVVENAVWDPTCTANSGSPVGTICGATCTAPTTPSVPITSTCTAGAAGTADWSTTAAAAFCGVLRTEALLEFQATTPDGLCTQAATDEVRSSVETFMTAQPDVLDLQVTVTCYNADGTIGAQARRAFDTSWLEDSSPAWRRRLRQEDVELQQSLLEQEVASMLQTQGATHAHSPEVATIKIWEQVDGRLEQQDAEVLQLTAIIRFAVDVLFIGPETAGTALVSTATTDPNAVGNLANNVAAVTNSTTEILPNGTTGSVSGGDTPINPGQDIRLSLLRTGTPDLRPNTTFFLSATLTTGLVPLNNTIVTGPIISPPGAVTCLPDTPSSQTNAQGVAQWACTTGTTPGNVTISVDAEGMSASLSFLIGTDCVGDFTNITDCSSTCGPGTRQKTFQITTPAADGGLECAYTDGQVVTEPCTGPIVCDANANCTASGCVCNPPLQGTGLPGNCTPAVAAAGTRFYHASCINPPAAPSEPSGTFTGTLIRAGSGGDYSTLSAAVAAASPGDRIQVLTGTITETSVVSITKSLEIFGTGSSCIVRRDSSGSVGGPVISINANNVYVHDLAVVNMHVPSTDSGGQSSCITAATMTETPLNINGADGIYITRCAFTYPKFGVSIDAAGWVVKDCVFTPNSNTPATTLRAMGPYGCNKNPCFIKGNTFNNPASESGRLIAIAINAAGPRGAFLTTGYNGSMVISDNVISSTGSPPRAYIDTTGMYRQPGNLNTLGSNGQFSLYIFSNDFSINYTSSPCLFYAAAGAYTPAVNKVQAFGFFDVLAAWDNKFGLRTGASSQKGGLFFTSGNSSATILGTFATGFYANNNVFVPGSVPIGATYTNASRLPGLLVVEGATADGFGIGEAPPQPPLTPAAPGPAAGLLVVDGVQSAAGDVVFAEDTCNAVNSGLFVASSGTWGRTPSGVFAPGQDAAGATIDVGQGFLYGATSWEVNNAPGTGLVGVDALSFSQVSP